MVAHLASGLAALLDDLRSATGNRHLVVPTACAHSATSNSSAIWRYTLAMSSAVVFLLSFHSGMEGLKPKGSLMRLLKASRSTFSTCGCGRSQYFPVEATYIAPSAHNRSASSLRSPVALPRSWMSSAARRATAAISWLLSNGRRARAKWELEVIEFCFDRISSFTSSVIIFIRLPSFGLEWCGLSDGKARGGQVRR